MADPTYVSQSTVAGGTTSVSVTCQATTAGNKLWLFASTNGSAIGSTLAGWTYEGTVAGGTPTMREALFTRTATGSEGGTVYTVTGMTGGTKSIGYIVQTAPGTAGDTLVYDVRTWIDSDNTSTAIAGTAGSAWTSTADCLILSSYTGLAPSGTYTSATINRTIAQTGATVSTTARFGAGFSSNTGAYGFQTGAVTSPGTGTPSFSGNTVGANWSGVGFLVLLAIGSASVDVTLTGEVSSATVAAPSGSLSATTNVALAGAVTGATVSSPDGTLALATSVALTGATVVAATDAPTGVASLTTNIDDDGAPATVTVTAPAGSLSASSGNANVSLTGAVTGATVNTPAGSLRTDVALTGSAVTTTIATPDGSLNAGAAISLTGSTVGATTTAPAGAATNVSSIALTGAAAGSTTAAPAGSESRTVTLTGSPASVSTGSPAGTLTRTVTLTGEVSAATLSAHAGQLALSSLVTLLGQPAGAVVSAPAGVAAASDVEVGHPVLNPALVLTTVDSRLTLTSFDNSLEIT